MIDRLPTKDDFVPHPPDLGQVWAWEHFGGLTLDEAKARFAENSEYYQEDFMFMGTRAFLYYFPVLDHHLRNAPNEEADHDHESWIISRCIRAQFKAETIHQLRPLIQEVMDLADFVRTNVDRFGLDELERQRVSDSWAELVRHIEAVSAC